MVYNTTLVRLLDSFIENTRPHKLTEIVYIRSDANARAREVFFDVAIIQFCACTFTKKKPRSIPRDGLQATVMGYELPALVFITSARYEQTNTLV